MIEQTSTHAVFFPGTAAVAMLRRAVRSGMSPGVPSTIGSGGRVR